MSSNNCSSGLGTGAQCILKVQSSTHCVSKRVKHSQKKSYIQVKQIHPGWHHVFEGMILPTSMRAHVSIRLHLTIFSLISHNVRTSEGRITVSSFGREGRYRCYVHARHTVMPFFYDTCSRKGLSVRIRSLNGVGRRVGGWEGRAVNPGLPSGLYKPHYTTCGLCKYISIQHRRKGVGERFH